ncbi:hypothetical protein U0070_006530 [Myodes glareolus]|uniref:NADH dehydrogenase subunit 1 n=1 Tax=Myodes glareolus TaxID=447135 RepID=A0AAW0JQM6_MYOGA
MSIWGIFSGIFKIFLDFCLYIMISDFVNFLGFLSVFMCVCVHVFLCFFIFFLLF